MSRTPGNRSWWPDTRRLTDAVRLGRQLAPRRWRLAAVMLAGLVAAGVPTAAVPATAQPSSPAAGTPSAAQPSGSAVAVTAAPSPYGKVLFTAGGKALYVFTFDETTGHGLPLHSTCTGSCATAWPPLLAPGPDGPLTASGGVHRGELGTVPRTGPQGQTEYQVTYYGHPLYEFVRDTTSGAVTGENVAAFNGIFWLDHVSGRPAPGQAHVMLENSPSGPTLAAATAHGTYRSQYMLTYDPQRATTCTGPCTGIWPPLLTGRQAAAGTGVRRNGLGILHRPDGTLQVTYFGHPVYYFAFDLGPGAPSGLTNGEYYVDQFSHGVWWLLNPDGSALPGPVSVTSMSSPKGTVLAVNPPSPFASRPFAMYTFSADSPAMSACTGACARYWPPVLTTGPATAASGSGVSQAGLGAIARPDGTMQVTYDGHPLYFFAFDQPGQTLGEDITAFGGTFRVVSLAGMPES
jgi:predicted lipoprotein with Yx(FWY)xxD motif